MNARIPALKDDEEKRWAEVFIQGLAALKPSPMDKIVIRLVRLKLLKPTQNMSEEEVEIFIGDIAEMLDEMQFSYHAIDQGIKNFLRSDKGVFFPNYRTLESNISAVHRKLKMEMDMVGKMLEAKKQRKLK